MIWRRGAAVFVAAAPTVATERRRVVITSNDPRRLAAVLNSLADRRFGAD